MMKKIISIILTLTLIFSFIPNVSAAVDTNDTAVEVIQSLGIYQGNENGDLELDKAVTRAEFATIMTRILDAEHNAVSAPVFNDVPADFWGYDAIMTCYNMGIINGYGDGNFGPNDNVTYEQAVKMLVASLGFEKMAQTKGGYPTGYLVVANQYGMTSGVKATVDAPAKRGIIAELVYNALDCPIMEQGTYGTEEYWYVYDGISRVKKTILSEKLDIAKLTGVIVANPKTAFDTGISTKDKISVKLTEDVVTKYASDYAAGSTYGFYIAGSRADALLGHKVDIYVTETTRNSWDTIVAVTEDTEITFSSVDVDTVKTNGTSIYLEKDKVDVTNAIVLKNNNAYSVSSLVSDLLSNNAGQIKAIDWNNDASYDFVVVNNYQHAVVDSVNASSGVIRTKNYGNIDVRLNDDTAMVSIKDVNGNNYNLADIKEDDVLAIVSDNPASNPGSFTSVLDIVVLPNSIISGTVTETILPSTSGSIDSLSKIYIDGTPYSLSVLDKNNFVNFNKIDANSVGTFYLTIDGKILGFEGDKAASGNYAFILATGITTGGIGAGEVQVKVLTAEGKIVICSVSDNLTVVATDGTASSYDVDANETISLGGTWNGGIKDVINSLASNTSPIADRLVKLNITSAGKINRIEILSSDATGRVEYRADANRLGNNLLDSSAVVFDINAKDNYEATTVKTVSSFVNKNLYEGYLYGKEDGYYEAAMITYSGSKVDGFAVVTGVTNIKTEDNKDAKKVRYIQNGSSEEEVAIIIDGETLDLSSGTAVSAVVATIDLEAGDIAAFGADAFAKIADRTGATYTLTTYASAVENSGNNDCYVEDVKYVYGYITDIINNNNIILSDNQTYYIGNNVNQYYFKHISADKYTLTAGSWWSGKVDKEESGLKSYVLLKIYDDNVIDIIALDSDTRAN